MKLKVSDQQLVALSDEAQVQCKVVVCKHSLTFVHLIHFIVDQIFLGHRVVVIQSVAPPRLRVSIARVIKKIEGIHIIEHWRLKFVEKFLVQRIEIFPIVNYDFAVCSRHQPLVVRL